MKRILTFALALVMVLSLAACGSKSDDNKKNDNEVTMTAQEVLDQLKKSLGDSYASDTAETEDRMSGYYGLDMSKIESWAADLQRVLNARLFVSGNYVALLIEGAQGDWQVSDEEQAKFAAEEAVKVDDAWKAIFGSAENSISIPEDDGNSGLTDDSDNADDSDLPVLGG